MTQLNSSDRRTFLRRGAMGAGAFWALSLDGFMARRAEGSPVVPSPYGPIAPVADETTGLKLIQLPTGFRYRSYSWTGDMMSDGIACPSLHDGMAVIDELHGDNDDDRRDRDDRGSNRRDDHYGRRDDDRGDHDDDDDRRRSSRLVLVRNHEPGAGTPYILNRPEITFAPDGGGGTTNLVFDARRGRWLSAYSTLAGTIRNCAGGVTPWGTWVTSEETTEPGHGWNFEVGVEAGDPTPLVDMGRFSHEAVMVDPRTGYVYETEDSGDCGFYKFVPNRRGRLERGGSLYMLKVRNEPNADLGSFHPVGTTWPVQWVRIDDPRAIFDAGVPAGLRQRGGQVPPSRRRLVGRADWVLPLDQRRAAPARGRCSSTTRAARRSSSFMTHPTPTSSTTRTT